MASSQNLQERAKLKMGVIRTTRIREHKGLTLFSFSRAQAYSHIPQPVHLLESTETNFLDGNFEADIGVTRDCLNI